MVTRPTEGEIDDAISFLEEVERLFSNETGHNKFRLWLKALSHTSSHARWIGEDMDTAASYIFNLISALQDEQIDPTEVS